MNLAKDLACHGELESIQPETRTSFVVLDGYALSGPPLRVYKQVYSYWLGVGLDNETASSRAKNAARSWFASFNKRNKSS